MLVPRMYVYIAEINKDANSTDGYVRMYIDNNYESAKNRAEKEAVDKYGENAICNVIDCEKDNIHTQEIGYALGLSIEESTWENIHNAIDVMPTCKMDIKHQ